MIDLSHNETFDKIPDFLFDLDHIFDFINFGEPFPLYKELKRYDLLILGNIKPAVNKKDHLFLNEEIRNIQEFFKNGGRVLTTTSSGGDYDYTIKKGSLRALKSVTGVKRYWWGKLINCTPFNPRNNIQNRSQNSSQNNSIFYYNRFPKHAIFRDVKELVLNDCTFLETIDNPFVKELLLSGNNVSFRYSYDDYIEEIESVPLLVVVDGGFTKSITIGSSSFMSLDTDYGINIADNKTFFHNVIEWLLS
ncbi:MAG: hypothetical protein GF364_11705 [Candidatus Lokiarchaeota archaeon]|nr:hypothetical protein [Candidatus Lokiarchaeota archaeon]